MPTHETIMHAHGIMLCRTSFVLEMCVGLQKEARVLCRQHVGQAVVRAGTSFAYITATAPDGAKQRTRVPVMVLALYSAMLHHMVQAHSLHHA